MEQQYMYIYNIGCDGKEARSRLYTLTHTLNIHIQCAACIWNIMVTRFIIWFASHGSASCDSNSSHKLSLEDVASFFFQIAGCKSALFLCVSVDFSPSSFSVILCPSRSRCLSLSIAFFLLFSCRAISFYLACSHSICHCCCFIPLSIEFFFIRAAVNKWISLESVCYISN